MKKHINKEEKQVRMTEPKYYDDLIALYLAFRDTVFNPSSVLHPACYDDASPSKVFAQVTYVDIETEIMKMFRQHGLDAYGQDIREYKPKVEHDLAILLNPQMPAAWASQHIRSGGYILANDYHKTARGMYEQPKAFELVGTLDFVEPDRRKGDMCVRYSQNLEGLYVPVQDFDELKNLRPEAYDFIIRAHGNMWKIMRLQGTSEENYLREQEIGGDPVVLPSKRVADRYIFRKR